MTYKLQVINQDGQLLVDSREVAEMTEKRHTDLLRSIDNYVDILLNAKMRSVDFFIEGSYKDSTGRTLKCYFLTKKGCDMVANKMTGEKGVIFTATYVSKFEEMDRQLRHIPSYLIDDQLNRARMWIIENEEKKQLAEQLQLATPKLEKYDQFLNANGLMEMGDVAKIVGMGRNKLYAFLRDKKVLMKGNSPYQPYINRGLFKMKSKNTNIGVVQVTLVTPKGADYIAGLVNKTLHEPVFLGTGS